MSHLMLELPDGLQEGLAFDITHGTAHLNDGDAGVCVSKIAVKAALDLVGDVGNDLYGAAAVVSPPFFLQNRPVDLTGGHIGVLMPGSHR